MKDDTGIMANKVLIIRFTEHSVFTPINNRALQDDL